MIKGYIKLAYATTVLACIIFALDVYFSVDIATLAYVMPILLATAISNDKAVTGTAIIGLVLIVLGFFLAPIIGVNYFQEDSFYRVISFISVFSFGYILSEQKRLQQILKEQNDTLELRILARTAASEARAKILKRQVEILQGLNTKKTNDSVYKLEQVILELKKLTQEERNEG